MKKLILGIVVLLIALTAITTATMTYRTYQSANEHIATHTVVAKLDEKGLVDFRPYLRDTLGGQLPTASDFAKGIVSNQSLLSMNENIVCDSLTVHDKGRLLDGLGLTFVQKNVLKAKFAFSDDQDACRLYLSQISTSPEVVSAYATSQVHLDAPLANLTHCGLHKLFTIANLDTTDLLKQTQPSASCDVNDIGAKVDMARHPLNQAQHYSDYTNTDNVPLTTVVNTVNRLAHAVTNLKSQFNEDILIDTSVVNIATRAELRYTDTKDTEDQYWPMASVAKLFIARAIVDNNVYTPNVDKYMPQMLCHSNTSAAAKLFQFSKTRAKEYINDYNVTTFGNLPRVVLTTENQGITSYELQRFLIDFAQELVAKGKYLDNSLGAGCTASQVSLPEGYKVIFAKTGTAFVTPNVKAKLLTIAYENTQGVPYVILIRIHASTGNSICAGDGCFDNANLQPLVTTLAESNI